MDEKWHVGWDWHAGMWFVEPPPSHDVGDTEWFAERHEAFEYVDDQIRKWPAEVDVTQDIPAQPKILDPALRGPVTDTIHNWQDLVRNPAGAQKVSPRSERLATYAELVGIK